MLAEGERERVADKASANGQMGLALAFVFGHTHKAGNNNDNTDSYESRDRAAFGNLSPAQPMGFPITSAVIEHR